MTAPSPLGTTIGWFDMDPTMPLLTGVDAVADAVLVRITTPYLWYDPSFGYDVNQLLNASVASPTVVLQRINREIKKDPRVSSATGTASFSGETLTISIVVTLITDQTFTVIGRIDTVNPSSFDFTYLVQPPQ